MDEIEKERKEGLDWEHPGKAIAEKNVLKRNIECHSLGKRESSKSFYRFPVKLRMTASVIPLESGNPANLFIDSQSS